MTSEGCQRGLPGPGNDVLECARYSRNGIEIISVRGEIDWATAPILREALAGAMAADPPRIILSLAEVTFLDSAGLSVLIRAHRHAAERRGWVRLAGPGRRVSEILRITDVDRIVPIHPTLDAALAQADGPPRGEPEPAGSVDGEPGHPGPAESVGPGPRQADLN